MCATHHDEAAQFMHILSHHKSRTHVRTLLTPEDFVPLVQDVVDSHPGLGFLKEATEFHSRYVHTVSNSDKNLQSSKFLVRISGFLLNENI